jgi:hypothetical protein
LAIDAKGGIGAEARRHQRAATEDLGDPVRAEARHRRDRHAPAVEVPPAGRLQSGQSTLWPQRYSAWQ